MVRIDKSQRREAYQICITVIEARHLEPNTNPVVVVRVGNHKKKTSVRRNSDNPYYNEYFVFDLTCNMETLLNTQIEISVYLVRRIIRSKFHGNIVFEAATVWDQPDHQYYHKWAMLTNPKDLKAGPRGYVKCNIVINVKGHKFKIPPESDGDEDIEGNLLLPMGDSKHFASRRHAQYVFTVHRAEDLSVAGTRRTYTVGVSFLGMKGSARASGRAGNPKFNKRIVFKEMYPPLSHRARIIIKRHNETLASYLINLKNISSSGEYNFLPTFGPSFVHLYAEVRPVTEPIYRGRLLLSIRTEIKRIEHAKVAGVEVEEVPAIVENSLWNTEQYVLVGVFYNVSMIDRSLLSRGKSVSFEMSLGNAGNRKYSKHQRACFDELGEDDVPGPATGCATSDSQSETLYQTLASRDRLYYSILFGAQKPCVFVKSWWPSTEWRIRNANYLAYIADHLEAELQKVEALAIVFHEKTFEAYNKAVRSLRQHCTEYVQNLKEFVSEISRQKGDVGDWCLTDLDKHRLNICEIEIQAVLQRVKTNGELVDNRLLKIAMTHAYRHLATIKSLCIDPQHSLPDVSVWMITGSHRLAYARVPAKSIFFAESTPERGVDCGFRRNVFLSRPGREDSGEVCKIELFLWLGLAKHVNKCWDVIPPGYTDMEIFGSLTFPRTIVYKHASKFQLRAHIFQGRFDPGMDSSGLLDPLLRVIFQGYTISTRVIKQTLDAHWDQTLVFPPVEMFATREHVKNHPPQVVIEALDRDFGVNLLIQPKNLVELKGILMKQQDSC